MWKVPWLHHLLQELNFLSDAQEPLPPSGTIYGAVEQHTVPLEMTNPTPPCQNTAQCPTLPSDMPQTMYMAPIMIAKAITHTEHSVIRRLHSVYRRLQFLL